MSNHLFDAIRRQRVPTRLHPDGRRRPLDTMAIMLEHSGRIASALDSLGAVGRSGGGAGGEEPRGADACISPACARARSIFPSTRPITLAELDYFFAGCRASCSSSARRLQRRGILEARADHGAKVETLDEKSGGSLIDLARDNATGFRDADRGSDDLAAILYNVRTTGAVQGRDADHDNLPRTPPRFAHIGASRPTTG